MSKNLFRYISFEDFINLIINNKDRYTWAVLIAENKYIVSQKRRFIKSHFSFLTAPVAIKGVLWYYCISNSCQRE